MNRTQKQYVKGILLKEGRITRNRCLSLYISRLGAIICALKKEGMEIEGGRLNGDYQYTLLNRQKRIVSWNTSSGVAVPIYG